MLFCGSRSFLSLPSAEGKRYRRYSGVPFFLTLSRGFTYADTAAQPVEARKALPGRGIFAMTWRVHCRRPAAGGLPGSPGGDKRGRDTKASLPLLTPQPFLRTRLPSVARLKARGPQGRLVLQGHTLDRSGAFRSGTPPPCTVWPRTDMRGKSRKVNSGHNSCPISKTTHGTEPP